MYRTLSFVLLLTATVTKSPAAHAACTTGHRTVDQEFRESDYVVIGKVIGIRQNVPVRLPYRGGFYKSRVAVQKVLVEKQFTGSPRHTITYGDEYSSARFPMTLGRRYLLFYSRDKDTRDLFIDSCGNSQEAPPRGATLLKRLTQLALR